MNIRSSSHALTTALPSTRRLALSFALVTVIILASLLPVAAAPPVAPAAPQTHKVIAAAGLLDSAAPGVSLWHDYGAFGLYQLSDAALASLPAAVRSQLQVDPQIDTILFDRHPIDTAAGEADVPALLASKAPSGPALHLVQFVGPIQQSWLDAVQATGASLVQYIANNAYLVWSDAASRSQLDALALNGDFVQYSGPYQPAFKLGSSIEAIILTGTDPNQVVPVVVQIYNHPGKKASQDVIARLTVESQSGWSPILAFENSNISVRSADLLTIARLPDVVWIGERFPRQLDDEVQGQIIAGNLNGAKRSQRDGLQGLAGQLRL